MSTTDARGHTVPEGTDPAARQSLLDLSMSIPSIRALPSAAAATQHVQALAAAGQAPSAEAPAYVYRTDLSALAVWDGTSWTYTLDHEIVLIAAEATKPSFTPLKIAAGSQILTTDGEGKAVLDWKIAFKYVITIIIATGDRTAAHTVSKGQWNNVQGCDIFAAHVNGSPAARANVRVNYIVLGW